MSTRAPPRVRGAHPLATRPRRSSRSRGSRAPVSAARPRPRRSAWTRDVRPSLSRSSSRCVACGDARVASLNVSEDPERKYHESVRKDAEADGAADEVFVRREARRSSSVERENAALEIERVTDIADFERRVAARREALTENGMFSVPSRAGREKAPKAAHPSAPDVPSDARARAARTENAADLGTRGTGNAGVVLTPEPPTSGLPAGAEGGASPARWPPPEAESARDGAGAGKHALRGEKRFAHEKRPSLSGDGDFIAFDTTLPVPPASPSERDGRARATTRRAAGREGLSGFRAAGATSAPASPDSPDSDEQVQRDGNASAGGAKLLPRRLARRFAVIALTARRGVAIAQAHAKAAL